jgi:hypothetical protein
MHRAEREVVHEGTNFIYRHAAMFAISGDGDPCRKRQSGSLARES